MISYLWSIVFYSVYLNLNTMRDFYENYALIREILIVFLLFILVSLLINSLISIIHYNRYVM